MCPVSLQDVCLSWWLELHPWKPLGKRWPNYQINSLILPSWSWSRTWFQSNASNQNCYIKAYKMGIHLCKACSDLIQTRNCTFAWGLSSWRVSSFKFPFMHVNILAYILLSVWVPKLFAAMHGHVRISSVSQEPAVFMQSFFYWMSNVDAFQFPP